MKAFAIRDAERSASAAFGYLLYYKKEQAFFIELPTDADPWEVPLLLSSFAKRGQYTIDAYWSRLWVRQRIVPVDRQNLGQILKANGLKAYDEYALLMLDKGRCAQDGYYLQEIKETDIPADIRQRWDKKVEEVVPCTQGSLILFFKNGAAKRYEAAFLLEKEPRLAAILHNDALFQAVNMLPGGYGISWGERLSLLGGDLYEHGTDVPLALDDLKGFVKHRMVNAAQAQALLGCTRQNINELERSGLLHPIREDAKNTLYLKSEVMRRVRDASGGA
jgi:DNA-binding transcriptional MerR regulator